MTHDQLVGLGIIIAVMAGTALLLALITISKR